MTKRLVSLVCAIGLAAGWAMAGGEAAKPEGDKAVAKPACDKSAVEKTCGAAKSGACYVCTSCKTAEMKAGKCAKCGAELQAMNCMSAKDGAAAVCACKGGCKCEMKGDACSCGKETMKVTCTGMKDAAKKVDAAEKKDAAAVDEKK